MAAFDALSRLSSLDLDAGNDEHLFGLFSTFVRSLPVPQDDVSALADAITQKATSDHQREIACLFVLELYIYFPASGPQKNKVDKLIASLAHLSPTSLKNDQPHTVAMIKYHDLVTDYQYLLCNEKKNVKLVELMTKKLTVVSPLLEKSCVVDLIHHKVAMYYLLCGSDRRKAVIYLYLQDKGVIRLLQGEMLRFFHLFCGSSLVPHKQYRMFIEWLQMSHYCFYRVMEHQSSAFLRNFLDCNINKLPRYYLGVSFDRIWLLLGDEQAQVNIEDFIYDMVISTKLPSGTKIDQVEKMVYFDIELVRYDDLNTRTKTVCDLVESL